MWVIIMSIKENVIKFNQTIKDYPNISVVVASKYVDYKGIIELYDAGIRHVGENRTEVFLEKYEFLKNYDLNWHFIGTLQSRKVKDVIDKIDYLHSLDRLSLAKEINKHSNKKIKCFIQVNISDEESKHGLHLNEVIPFIKELEKYDKIEVIGLMGMAALNISDDEIAKQFKSLQDLSKEILSLNLPYAQTKDLSMGMSHDYLIALKYGATYLRVGSVILK